MHSSNSRILLFVFSLLAMYLSSVTPADAVKKNWADVSADIEKALGGTLKIYESGKNWEAMETVADAYFGIFEGEKANMEIAVRRFISLKEAIKLEKGFTEIRKAMHKGAPVDRVSRQVAELIKALREAAGKLDGKGVGLDVNFR